MTLQDIRDRGRPLVQARLATVRVPMAVVGALFVAVGTNAPWATFPGFPGKMTLALYPGGARLYVLVLAASVVLTFVDLPGRRRAARIAGLGAAGITAYTVIAIAADGGGLVNVAYGAWLALLGSLLLAAAATALPADRQPGRWRTLAAPIEMAIVVALLVLLLYVIVRGLNTDESSLFIAYLGFLGIAAAALSRLGVSAWVSALTARHRTVTIAAAAAAAVAFPLTQNGEAYYLRIAASIGVFAAAAIGLNVVVGLAGLLDLGYVAFFGVGAYVGALFSDAALTTLHVHVPFLLVILMGATISALFGVLIGAPTLRLRGDYLAIVTLGFGEIFRITANNLDGSAGPNVTRGPNGIAGIPDLGIGGFNLGDAHSFLGFSLPGFANYYYAELVLLAFVILAFVRLNESRIGRAWVAIREDEIAATAMGINTIRLKLLAFAIGAFLAGAAGTVNAHVATQVSPDSYTFLESIFLLAAVVLGGMGTVPGALLGSTLLILLPEKLRAFQENRLLIFGLALVLMMRFRPEGIVPSRRRQREFHEDAGGADALSQPAGATVPA